MDSPWGLGLVNWPAIEYMKDRIFDTFSLSFWRYHTMLHHPFKSYPLFLPHQISEMVALAPLGPG